LFKARLLEFFPGRKKDDQEMKQIEFLAKATARPTRPFIGIKDFCARLC